MGFAVLELVALQSFCYEPFRDPIGYVAHQKEVDIAQSLPAMVDTSPDPLGHIRDALEFREFVDRWIGNTPSFFSAFYSRDDVEEIDGAVFCICADNGFSLCSL